MSAPTSARAVVLEKYADSKTDPSSLATNFVVKELPLPNPIPDDSLLVKTLYLSNDPAQRLWMQRPGEHSGQRTDMAGLVLGQPFEAFTLSRVVQVGGEDGPIRVGDIVEARTKWSDYWIVKKKDVRTRKQKSDYEREMPGISLSAYLGTLGISGATAYMALIDVLKPKEMETLVVSGAAGAVGNVAVQYAKKGLGVKCVVAIAGSNEKCAWLKTLGADEALNYKSPTFVEDLAKATPNKIDKFFDNVGGSILDEVILRMNPHGVIAAVGAISLYNKLDQPANIRNYVRLISDRLSIVGYSIIDYRNQRDEIEAALASAAAAGKLSLKGTETIVDVHGRLEEVPSVWSGLFVGANTGKLITKLAD